MCAENVERHAFRFPLKTLQKALASLGTSAMSEEEMYRVGEYSRTGLSIPVSGLFHHCWVGY